MILQIIEILLIFILPVVLIYFKVIPFKYRKQTLITISVVTALIVLLQGWTLFKLGIRLDNIRETIIPYILATIIGVIFLFTVSKLLKRKRQIDLFKKKHLMYGFIIVSILQEFMFRGFLFPVLQEIFKDHVILILINAILFTLIHSIYSNDTISLVMIFLAGITFASLYYVYPNLILISISHAITNYIAVSYNFYYEEKTSLKVINYWEKTKGFVKNINPRRIIRKRN